MKFYTIGGEKLLYEENKQIEYLLNRDYYIFNLAFFYEWLEQSLNNKDPKELSFLIYGLSNSYKNLTHRRDIIKEAEYKELLSYYNAFFIIYEYLSENKHTKKEYDKMKKLLLKVFSIEYKKGNIYLINLKEYFYNNKKEC